jgi:hypothetical protein
VQPGNRQQAFPKVKNRAIPKAFSMLMDRSTGVDLDRIAPFGGVSLNRFQRLIGMNAVFIPLASYRPSASVSTADRGFKRPLPLRVGSGYRQDCFDPPHLSVGQAYLDAVGMMRGTGEDGFDRAPGKAASALVCFENNLNLGAGGDVFAVLAVHFHRSGFTRN